MCGILTVWDHIKSISISKSIFQNYRRLVKRLKVTRQDGKIRVSLISIAIVVNIEQARNDKYYYHEVISFISLFFFYFDNLWLP